MIILLGSIYAPLAWTDVMSLLSSSGNLMQHATCNRNLTEMQSSSQNWTSVLTPCYSAIIVLLQLGTIWDFIPYTTWVCQKRSGLALAHPLTLAKPEQILAFVRARTPSDDVGRPTRVWVEGKPHMRGSISSSNSQTRTLVPGGRGWLLAETHIYHWSTGVWRCPLCCTLMGARDLNPRRNLLMDRRTPRIYQFVAVLINMLCHKRNLSSIVLNLSEQCITW